MGEKLAEKIRRQCRSLDVDVVIPIPDSSDRRRCSSRPAWGVPYREGFVKNRYIGRTFIMPGQAVRSRSVRQKLNPMSMESQARTCCWWTTRSSAHDQPRDRADGAPNRGARKVFFASAAPPVRFPTSTESTCRPRRADRRACSEEEVAREIGADALIYQDLDALKDAVRRCQSKLKNFETSCFDGHYITGDITATTCATSRSGGCHAGLGDDAESDSSI